MPEANKLVISSALSPQYYAAVLELCIRNAATKSAIVRKLLETALEPSSLKVYYLKATKSEVEELRHAGYIIE